jgi:type II secretion system protein C
MIGLSTQIWLRWLAWLGLVAAVALGAVYARWSAALPAPGWGNAGALIRLPDWTAVQTEGGDKFDASVFKKREAEPMAAEAGPLAKRFRLAGTFFAIGNNQNARKAILDDLQRKEQKMVAEGELLDQAVMVVAIFSERIIIRAGGRDEELRLSFSGQRALPAVSNQAALKPGAGVEAMLNRFGKRVGETRWLLKRDELLKYYAELLNNTERLAKVFDSLKPVYKSGKIAGYTLIVEGEADMFGAFGLKQNDVVRAMNSMPMTSQQRAEYFIREFVNNRVNAFVLDIEREGKPEQLIYLVR